MTGIVLAYDRSTYDPLDQKLLTLLTPEVDMVKIGLEAFSATLPNTYTIGMTVHNHVKSLRGKTLEDWKLHDIGTTMAKATTNIVKRADALTVHASASLGGLNQVIAARDAAQRPGLPTMLIGVTVLTDLDSDECFETYQRLPTFQVITFAEKLIAAKFDAIVCSGHELAELSRRGLLKHLKTLVPGTRPSWAENNDQKRVMTYNEVAELGATWTVVGRVAMQAENPLEAIGRVREELGLPITK